MSRPSLPPGFFMNAGDAAEMAAQGEISSSPEFELDIINAIYNFTICVEFSWPPSKRMNDALRLIASGTINNMAVGMARLYLLDSHLESIFRADLDDIDRRHPLAVVEAVSKMKERAASMLKPGQPGNTANEPLDRLLLELDTVADRYGVDSGLGSHENMSAALDEVVSSDLPTRIKFVRAGVVLACRYGERQTSGGLNNDRRQMVDYYVSTSQKSTPRAISGRLNRLKPRRAIASKIDRLRA